MLQNLIQKYQLLHFSAQKELMSFLENLLQKQENNKKTQKPEPENLALIINQYQGIGAGIWQVDAQGYIKDLRENDRV